MFISSLRARAAVCSATMGLLLGTAHAASPVEAQALSLPAGAQLSEQRFLLGQVRWWVAPEAQRQLAARGAEMKLTWQTPPQQDAGLSDEERDQIGQAKIALSNKLFLPSPKAEAVAQPAATSPLRLQATVREVWRPNAILNVLIVALPGPGAPFVTQGGAAAVLELREPATNELLAAFECRQYAGVGAFAYAFGRTGHPRIALESCAELFAQTVRDGRPNVPSNREASTTQPTNQTSASGG